MSRLKDFLVWILVIAAFWIFSDGIIYIYMNGDELGMKIYNYTHQEEAINNDVEEEINEI